jgi:hypothetical protein
VLLLNKCLLLLLISLSTQSGNFWIHPSIYRLTQYARSGNVESVKQLAKRWTMELFLLPESHFYHANLVVPLRYFPKCQYYYLFVLLHNDFSKCTFLNVEAFWVITQCIFVVVEYQRFGVPCCFHLHAEDEGSTDLWNVGNLPQYYTALQPGRIRLETSCLLISNATMLTLKQNLKEQRMHKNLYIWEQNIWQVVSMERRHMWTAFRLCSEFGRNGAFDRICVV